MRWHIVSRSSIPPGGVPVKHKDAYNDLERKVRDALYVREDGYAYERLAAEQSKLLVYSATNNTLARRDHGELCVSRADGRRLPDSRRNRQQDARRAEVDLAKRLAGVLRLPRVSLCSCGLLTAWSRIRKPLGPLRQCAIFSSNFKLICPVQSRSQKYSASRQTPNHPYNSRHPVPRRGALAIVTNVGAGCGGRGSVRRERCSQGGYP